MFHKQGNNLLELSAVRDRENSSVSTSCSAVVRCEVNLYVPKVSLKILCIIKAEKEYHYPGMITNTVE